MMERYITDTLELPNSKKDLLVPINGKSSNEEFNDKLEKLQENFEYLLAMGTLNLPLSSKYPQNYAQLYLSISDDAGTIFSNASLYDLSIYPTISSFGNIVYKKYNTYGKISNIMCIHEPEKNSIHIYQAPEYSEVNLDLRFNANYTYVTTYNKVKQNGNLYYKNITGMDLSEDGHLYVVDSTLQLLIKYDLNDVILQTPQVKTTQKIKRIVNGNSSNDQINTFLPFSLKIYKDKLYTINAQNSTIDIYDLKLNHIKSISINTLTNMGYIDVGIDVNENIYVLYSTGYCLKYSYDGNLIDYGFVKDPIGSSEIYKRIIFNDNNPNQFFVVTDSAIFKKNVDRFTAPIGSFNFVHSEEQFKNISTYYDMDIYNGESYILTDKGIISVPLKDFYSHLYQTDYLNEFIDFEKAYDDEFEQDFVFNEKFQRLIYNHLLYYHIINRKVVVDYSLRGDEMFGGYTTQTKKAINVDSYLLGLNEVFSSNVFNRCISKIYELQSNILELLEPKRITKNPTTLHL